MNDFEAVVIGAGPAGCAAAYDLAAAGLSVLLIDNKAFPRVKPCAGALTMKSVFSLRYAIHPVVKSVVRGFEVCLGGSVRRLMTGRHPLAVTTVREELDAFCLEQTRKRGADFQVVKRIERISEHDGGVTLEAGDGQSIRAGFLVGADGANSRVRRLIGERPLEYAWALEGQCPLGADARDVMRFDFGIFPDGFGWSFPKGDHVNVGLYTRRASPRFGRDELAAYAQSVLGLTSPRRVVGFRLGVGGAWETPDRRRIFLAGDAAGMSEPLLGEGIYNAIVSGQAAARAIVAQARRGEDARLQRRHAMRDMRLDLRLCASLADHFYGSESLGYRILCAAPTRMALMQGCAAGKTLREIVGAAALAPFYAIRPSRTVVEFERANRLAS